MLRAMANGCGKRGRRAAASGVASAVPESMFGSGAATGTPLAVNAALGMRFYADVPGHITKIRVFQPTGALAGNTDPTIGAIWDSSGLLASVTFGAITDNAWNEATLTTPLLISANTVYTVSVNPALPSTLISYSSSGLGSQISNGSHLHSATGNNGVYSTPQTVQPTGSGAGENYWRDVVFEPS